MASPAAAIGAFLGNIGDAYKSREQDGGHRLAQTIPLDAASHQALKGALASSPISGDIARLVTTSAHVHASDRVHAFLVSFVEYVQRCPSTAELVAARRRSATQPSLTASIVSESFNKWAEVYSRASMVFQAQQESNAFGPTLRHIGTTLVLLAIAADAVAQDQSHPAVTEAVSRISRTTGVAAIDRTSAPGEQTKRQDVLWLANLSFRCYFKLKNIRLCETVLGSVENALTLNRNFATTQQKAMYASNASELGMACYTRADRVAYRYYLGRLRLSQHRIRAAYNELRWAFDNCTNAHMHNKTLILTHLVVVAVILGIYPKPVLLEATGLAGPFGALIAKLKQGDGGGVYNELYKWRDWHRRHGSYLLLSEKLEISAWRNLMRRTFLIARRVQGLDIAPPPAANGAPVKTPPPTLDLPAFLVFARRAFPDQDLTIDDVECVTASLIDQGYVKGYVSHSTGKVVLRRTPDFGFVRVSSVY